MNLFCVDLALNRFSKNSSFFLISLIIPLISRKREKTIKNFKLLAFKRMKKLTPLLSSGSLTVSVVALCIIVTVFNFKFDFLPRKRVLNICDEEKEVELNFSVIFPPEIF